MSLESKVVVLDNQYLDEQIFIQEAWGFEYYEKIEGGFICKRDTSNPKYPILVKNEKKYDELLVKYNLIDTSVKLENEVQKPKFNVLAFIVLLLLFIIPGIFYIMLYICDMIDYKKLKAKEEEKSNLSELKLQEKKEIYQQMEKLINDSRNYYMYDIPLKNIE